MTDEAKTRAYIYVYNALTLPREKNDTKQGLQLMWRPVNFSEEECELVVLPIAAGDKRICSDKFVYW